MRLQTRYALEAEKKTGHGNNTVLPKKDLLSIQNEKGATDKHKRKITKTSSLFRTLASRAATQLRKRSKSRDGMFSSRVNFTLKFPTPLLRIDN